MQQLRDRATARLARVEREFTATVVVSQDNTIYIPNSDYSRKRSKRIPNRLSDFIRWKDNYSGTHAAAVEPSITPVAVAEEPLADTMPDISIDSTPLPLASKAPPRPLLLDATAQSLLEQMRHVTVNVIKLPHLDTFEPWCMVHCLYKCFCKLKATQGNRFEFNNETATTAIEDYELVPKKRQYTFEKNSELLEPSSSAATAAAKAKALVAATQLASFQLSAARVRAAPGTYLKIRNRTNRDKVLRTVQKEEQTNPGYLVLLKSRVKKCQLNNDGKLYVVSSRNKGNEATSGSGDGKQPNCTIDETAATSTKVCTVKQRNPDSLLKPRKEMASPSAIRKPSVPPPTISQRAIPTSLPPTLSSMTELNSMDMDEPSSSIPQTEKPITVNDRHKQNVKFLNYWVTRMMDQITEYQKTVRTISRPVAKALTCIQWTHLIDQFNADRIYVWEIQLDNADVILAITIENVMPSIEKAICVINIKAVLSERLPLLAKLLKQGIRNEQTHQLAVLLCGATNYWKVVGFIHSDNDYMLHGVKAKPTAETHPQLTAKITKVFNLLTSRRKGSGGGGGGSVGGSPRPATVVPLPTTTGAAVAATADGKSQPATVSAFKLKTTNIPITSLKALDLRSIFVPIPVVGAHRWFMLTLGNDFSHIYIPSWKNFLSFIKISNALAFAKRSGKTVKMCGPDGVGPDVYAAHNEGDKIFFGPYKVDDVMNLALYQMFRGKMLLVEQYLRIASMPASIQSLRTVGCWLYMKDNQVVLEDCLGQDGREMVATEPIKQASMLPLDLTIEQQKQHKDQSSKPVESDDSDVEIIPLVDDCVVIDSDSEDDSAPVATAVPAAEQSLLSLMLTNVQSLSTITPPSAEEPELTSMIKNIQEPKSTLKIQSVSWNVPTTSAGSTDSKQPEAAAAIPSQTKMVVATTGEEAALHGSKLMSPTTIADTETKNMSNSSSFTPISIDLTGPSSVTGGNCAVTNVSTLKVPTARLTSPIPIVSHKRQASEELLAPSKIFKKFQHIEEFDKVVIQKNGQSFSLIALPQQEVATSSAIPINSVTTTTTTKPVVTSINNTLLEALPPARRPFPQVPARIGNRRRYTLASVSAMLPKDLTVASIPSEQNSVLVSPIPTFSEAMKKAPNPVVPTSTTPIITKKTFISSGANMVAAPAPSKGTISISKTANTKSTPTLTVTFNNVRGVPVLPKMLQTVKLRNVVTTASKVTAAPTVTESICATSIANKLPLVVTTQTSMVKKIIPPITPTNVIVNANRIIKTSMVVTSSKPSITLSSIKNTIPPPVLLNRMLPAAGSTIGIPSKNSLTAAPPIIIRAKTSTSTVTSRPTTTPSVATTTAAASISPAPFPVNIVKAFTTPIPSKSIVRVSLPGTTKPVTTTTTTTPVDKPTASATVDTLKVQKPTSTLFARVLNQKATMQTQTLQVTPATQFAAIQSQTTSVKTPVAPLTKKLTKIMQPKQTPPLAPPTLAPPTLAQPTKQLQRASTPTLMVPPAPTTPPVLTTPPPLTPIPPPKQLLKIITHQVTAPAGGTPPPTNQVQLKAVPPPPPLQKIVQPQPTIQQQTSATKPATTVIDLVDECDDSSVDSQTEKGVVAVVAAQSTNDSISETSRKRYFVRGYMVSNIPVLGLVAASKHAEEIILKMSGSSPPIIVGNIFLANVAINK